MARGTWGNPNTEYHPLKVRIAFQLGLSLCQTGFTLRDSSLTPSNPQACADDVATFVTTNFRTIFSSEDTMLGVDVVDMVTAEGGAVSFSNTKGTVNIGAEARMPSFITVPVSLKGELRKRYGQGRMLWPVRAEVWNDNEQLNSAGVTALQGVVTAMAARYLGAASSSDYTLINTHGIIPPKPATATRPAQAEVPPSWYDVTTIRLGTITSFLRSRKAGVGS